ncbi:TBCC domain-containing protein 1 [Histomonas meleagridis]|uniref:TBCC domain-containing protein 1 n=1 Tax=Histomonas meleagridis TaxID=135588 RepID=UPI003559FB01|nr:TBCC domain-containing protein 1 [Histomonas meleagridis]KAH0804046.1 TBCC domain-containing protein 1 [Histomonas meleagridis]
MEETPKALEIANVQSKTICVKSNSSNAIEIQNCKNSYIYIVKPIDTIIIKHCTDSLIFICSANIVTIDRSSQVKVTSYSQSIRVSKSHHINLYLYVNTQPIVSEGSYNIVIAPYNAASKFVLPTGKNFWNYPINESGASSSLMDPSDFCPLVVPFGDEPDGISTYLPRDFLKTLAKRERIAEERRKLVLEFCKRNPDYSELIQQKISESFDKYLTESKGKEQIIQLSAVEYW